MRETVRELGEQRATGFLKKFYGWYLGRGRFPRPFKQELVQLDDAGRGRDAAVRGCTRRRRRSLERLEDELPDGDDDVVLDLPDLDLRRRLIAPVSAGETAHEPCDLDGRRGHEVVDAAGSDSTRASGRAERKRAIAAPAVGSTPAPPPKNRTFAAAMSGYVSVTGSKRPPCLIAASDLGSRSARDFPVGFSHHRPVCLGQSGRPSSQRVALEGEIRIPARERVLIGLLMRLCDTGL